MGVDIEQRRADRIRFLNRLFDDANGSELTGVNMWPIAEQLGMDQVRALDAVHYLTHEGLIMAMGIGGTYSLTHQGIKVMEDARNHPDKPSERFPPLSIVIAGAGSQIQVGTVTSQQTINIPSDPLSLANFVAELKQLLDSVPLSDDDRAIVESQVTTLERPDPTDSRYHAIIVGALSVIRAVLSGIGSGAGSATVQLLLRQLTSMGIH